MEEAKSLTAAECKAKGNACLSAKDYNTAIQWYTAAIEKDGTNHVYYSNRSAAYLNLGNGAAALTDAESCIKVKGDWAKGYSRKGAALHKLNKMKEAIAAYEQGLKIDPSNAALKQGLAAAQKAAQPKMPNPFGPDMYSKLQSNPTTAQWLSDPNYVNTLNLLSSNPQMLQNPQLLQSMDPRILQTYMFLMGMGMPQGMPTSGGGGGGGSGTSSRKTESPAEKKARIEREAKEKAEKERAEILANETPEEKVIRENKEKADAVKAEGTAFYKKKEFDQAIEKYEAASKMCPTDMTYMLNIAACYLEQKKFDDCISLCKDAIDVGRENYNDFKLIAKAFERISMAYKKQKDYTSALEWMEKANLESSNDKRADKLLQLKRLKKKQDKAAYIDPAKALEAKERGNVQFKAGKFPKAIEEYTDAINRDPTNPMYYSNRAAAYQKLMDFQKAVEDSQLALKQDPKFTKAWMRKAGCEFFLKEYHKCMDSYKAVLDYEPENEEAKKGLERTVRKVNTSSGGEMDAQRQARAMADPEIQNILRDPLMNRILQDMSTDPVAAQKHMRDPATMAKIEKLIAAGVLKVGGAPGGQQRRK